MNRKTKFLGTSPTSVLQRLALNATTYHLWTERNCRLFQSKFRAATEVVTKIIEDVRLRVLVLDLQVEDNADNRWFFDKWRIQVQFDFRKTTMHAWHRPEQGWFKVNSNGLLTGTRGGYEAQIRDHDGLVVAAGAGSQRAQTILFHELQGIELGIKLAQRYGLHGVEFSMDSNTVFKYLTTDRVPPWEAIHTVRRIKKEIKKFEGCRIMHAMRETNQVADKLAKLLPNNEFIYIIPSSFAEDIKKIVFDDARGRKYARM